MSNFKFIETKIKDLYIIETNVFADSRGVFTETYNKQEFDNAGLKYEFVQDNQSFSHKGVLRGMHYQIIHPQAKLVRVTRGEVYDVAVDIRKDSETFGQWVGVILSDTNNRQLMIPRGFAHGFIVLSDYAVFTYKCDDFYYPNDEGGIIWNDPEISINWPSVDKIIISEKDKVHSNFSLIKENFLGGQK